MKSLLIGASIFFSFSGTVTSIGQTELDSPPKDLLDLIIQSSSGKTIELHDLYPKATSISEDSLEVIIIANYLKTKDFRITNWGRGNWMDGPRIINLTLKNRDCNCFVDKLYYSPSLSGTYRTTEQIRCEKINH